MKYEKNAMRVMHTVHGHWINEYKLQILWNFAKDPPNIQEIWKIKNRNETTENWDMRI